MTAFVITILVLLLLGAGMHLQEDKHGAALVDLALAGRDLWTLLA